MRINTHAASGRTLDRPNCVAGLILTVTFAGAFLLALEWDRKAAVFPLLVTGLGTLLAAALTIKAILSESDLVPADTPRPDDHQSSDDLEYAFASASIKAWTVVLSYFGLFFVCLAVLGLYVTAIAFTIVYLRWEGKRSWRFSVGYAGVLLGVLYGVFAMALAQPVPAGIFSIH